MGIGAVGVGTYGTLHQINQGSNPQQDLSDRQKIINSNKSKSTFCSIPPPQDPKCRPDEGLDPVKEITDQFVQDLVQEAVNIKADLTAANPKGGKNRTIAVGQAVDRFGNRQIVVTSTNY